MAASRLRALILAVVLIGLGLAAAPAHASVQEAGLVVRYADGSTTYAYVTFAEPEITGIELLRRSGLSLVTVPFGPLGEAVCRIGDSGCSVDACGSNLCQSSADAPYWQYFRNIDGAWKAMLFGASATTVQDGDVDAWEWTAGYATLPALDIDAVRSLVGAGAEVGAGDVAGSPVARTYDAAGVARASGDATGRGVPASEAAAGLLALLAMAGGAAFLARRSRTVGGQR